MASSGSISGSAGTLTAFGGADGESCPWLCFGPLPASGGCEPGGWGATSSAPVGAWAVESVESGDSAESASTDSTESAWGRGTAASSACADPLLSTAVESADSVVSEPAPAPASTACSRGGSASTVVAAMAEGDSFADVVVESRAVSGCVFSVTCAPL